MHRSLRPIFLWLLPAATAYAQDPSFDCARARSPVEKAVCADADLGALDAAVAALYRQQLRYEGSDAAALKTAQQQWLRTVRNRCPDAACLKQAHAARLWQLATPAPTTDTDLLSLQAHVLCAPAEHALRIVSGAQPLQAGATTWSADLREVLVYEEDEDGRTFGIPWPLPFTCVLDGVTYSGEITPWMRNLNPMGECGGAFPALGLKLARNGQSVVPEDLHFADECRGTAYLASLQIEERGAETQVQLRIVPEEGTEASVLRTDALSRLPALLEEAGLPR